MAGALPAGRPPARILDALADVAIAAARIHPDPFKEPDAVAERAWNAARFTQVARYGSLPLGHELCRQLSQWLGRKIGWPAALKLALAGRRLEPAADPRREDGEAS